MSGLVKSLIDGMDPVGEHAWRDFWDRLHADAVPHGEAVAVLASLSSRTPGDDTLESLVASLRGRREAAREAWRETVNIVGTGGGPKTFNISTAAAVVAAAMGVRVVKTGSHAYASRCGSIDLLRHLRMPLADSEAALGGMLDEHNLAFAGYFVYPPELLLLAKRIVPFDIKTLGKCFNVVGPFLAAAPASAQVTGISDPALLPALLRLAANEPDKRIWICRNDLGVDELLSFADNRITAPPDGEFAITAEDVGLSGAGSLEDLRPAGSPQAIVEHFLAVLGGDAPPAAIETVCLNAAAMAIAGGRACNWRDAVTRARQTIEDGDARRRAEALSIGDGAEIDGRAERRVSNG